MTVNKDNVVALANFIQTEVGQEFHMRRAETCILEFAGKLWPDTRIDGVATDDNRLADKLGITYDMVQNMCFWTKDASGEKVDYSNISRERAVTMLHRLADTEVLYY